MFVASPHRKVLLLAGRDEDRNTLVIERALGERMSIILTREHVHQLYQECSALLQSIEHDAEPWPWFDTTAEAAGER